MPSALVVGGADCVFDDVIKALELFTPDAYLVINDMIPRWESRCDYAVSLHPDKLPDWLRARRINGYSEPGEVWAHRRQNSAVQRITSDWAGSSGLFSVKIAIEQGFDRIVLAGVPMEADRGHFKRNKTWNDAISFRSGWIHRYNTIKYYARSMSGWTKELLGAPTTEWLNETSVTMDPERV